MGISLYIHIPFCKSKCMYCDFCSYGKAESLMTAYTRALCDEILLTCKGKLIDTVFIGGGTPTYLSLEAWNILKKTIKQLVITEKAEFTVECNPGTIDEEKLQILKEVGVNRISIGLQAWQDRLLKKLGRIHSKMDFINSYELIRKFGFKNINVDIMFGLPDQSEEDFKETLSNVAELNPEHISSYSLIVEEDTPFGVMYKEDKLKLPDEEQERRMYEEAVGFLKEKGYLQYEISNFSRQGFECRHNSTYWELKEYIGCGAGAHSYVKGIRYNNIENIEKYIQSVNCSGHGIVESRENSVKDDMEEFMFMGLRMTKGVSKKEFYNRFRVSIGQVYEDVIKKYRTLNMLVDNGDNLYLTELGIQLSNTVMSDFILDK